MAITSSSEFFQEDFKRTLFPLQTNRFLIERGKDEIQAYIDSCFDETVKSQTFLSQKRVYASKPNFYLRRTVKLDVVAEYYVYDLVFRNRTKFRKPFKKEREHFGYRFEGGSPINPSKSYSGFKGAIAAHRKKYKFSVSFDVSSYFNSMYQHDLVSWMANIGASEEDHQELGQFLRQINTGRSVDCLPQGLYPTKMIGNDFLRFIDNHHAIKSEQLVRFMDDFCLFSNDEGKLQDDFIRIQRLLGERGLSLNPNKTQSNLDIHSEVEGGIDDVRTKLLKRRRYFVVIGYDANDEVVLEEHIAKHPISESEINYIKELLASDNLEEEDVELILAVMQENTTLVLPKLKSIFIEFPHLAKSIYSFCEHVKDREQLTSLLCEVIRDTKVLQEFQLFWFAYILEDYLLNTSNTSELIDLLYSHSNATPISRGKILEIPDARFGLPDLRDECLGAGQSDWLAWSAAVGHRNLKPVVRNHRLSYFANASPINKLINDIVLK